MFENDPDQGTENKGAEPQTIEDILATMVGDEKKYKTAEDAVKSIAPAQEHIQKLETELATLRDSVVQNKTQEELLDEMKAELAKVVQTPPQEPNKGTPDEPNKPDQKPKDDNLNGVDINALIAAQLATANQQQVKDANVNSVTELAIKAWGNDAKVKFYEAASKNGYSEEMIKQLAASSPQAALHAVGLKQSTTTNPMNSPAGTLRTTSPEFQNMEEPKPPENWGNDLEVAAYMKELQEYEDKKGK